MLTLLIAIFVASLLGSIHCACMCGPIAIWSSGSLQTSGQGRAAAKSGLAKRLCGYHLGRLFTYLLLGALAGVAGHVISLAGTGAGIQSAAARVAGAAMILIGGWRLSSLWRTRPITQRGVLAKASQTLASMIAATRPVVAKLPVFARSIAVGATTVLLPCGWLYLFVLFSTGTGSVASAMGVMFAFWMGTVPALVALVAGLFHAQHLQQRMPRLIPLIAASALILLGAHTATGRASADLKQLESRVSLLLQEPDKLSNQNLQALQNQPLPCCQHAK